MIEIIGIHSTDNHKKFTHVDNKLKTMTTFYQFFILLVAFGFSISMVFPFVFSNRKLLANIWFPLDWKSSRIAFALAYGFFEFGFFLSFVCCLFTVIVWYLMMNLSIKYELLENQFRNAGVIRTSVKLSKAEQEKLFLQDLTVAIQDHRKINEQIYQFASTFHNLFFLQILTSGLCICGSVFVLAFSIHDDLIQDGFYCFEITYNLFDIFMVTYFGNEIKTSSDCLSYCLFESNWIEKTQVCKKYIIIITEVLKKPQQIIIAKLYPINLETFTSIVNLAYSMFNILQNVSLRK